MAEYSTDLWLYMKYLRGGRREDVHIDFRAIKLPFY